MAIETQNILAIVEELNEMHDRLRFKSRVYTDASAAPVLQECALLLAQAADDWLKDIVAQLSALSFPFASRVSAAPLPHGLDPAQEIESALRKLAALALPVADMELIQMRRSLEAAKAAILVYQSDKTAAAADLSKDRDNTLRYLMSVSAAGEG